MLKKHFKIAWRNIWKHKLTAFINIGGLAGGIAVCMLIMSYVAHESSYDRFHQNAGRIFNAYLRHQIGTETIQMPYLSYVSAPLAASNPAVERYHRFRKEENKLVQSTLSPSLKFSEKTILFADSNFFSFFSFPLLKGNPSEVLNEPGKAVLSKSAAEKYFGEDDPVGQLLTYDEKHVLEIAGVAEEAPSNSSIRFDLVVSVSTLRSWEESELLFRSQQVSGGVFFTYFLLDRAESAVSLERTLNRLAAEPGTDDEQFYLAALPHVHFDANFGDHGNIKYIRIFATVGLLILLLALVNYVSLTTARATFRAEEVGVRKVLGASRLRVAWQFYVESVLLVAIAFALGFLLFELLRPRFYDILQLQVDRAFVYGSLNLGLFATLLILTILGAGAYPSFLLSSFNPTVLYGRFSRSGRGAAVRETFIVLQFVIAVGLISGGIIINSQLSYFRNVDTGIDRENVLMVPFGSSLGRHYTAFKQDVASLAGVQEVASARYPMYKGHDIFFATLQDQNEDFAVPIMTMDNNLLSLLDIQWKIPPENMASVLSGNEILINEAAIGKLNLSADPVGSEIPFGSLSPRIGGVVQNFNFESLHSKIDALALFVAPDSLSWAGSRGCLFVKTSPQVRVKPLITAIEASYSKFDKEQPFEYYFLDDTFDALYKSEDRLAQLFGFFTGVAVLISCLGLMGLVAFIATQRTKEIGIRKVLGASIAGVVALLTRDFIKLVLLAIGIATPLAWYAMNRWLQDFAYRIELKWWMFAGAGLLALVVALLTVSFQSVTAALMNPVKSLRSE